MISNGHRHAVRSRTLRIRIITWACASLLVTGAVLGGFNCLGSNQEVVLSEQSSARITQRYITSRADPSRRARSRALRRLLADGCKVRITEQGSSRLLSIDQFISSLDRMYFVESVNAITLREPTHDLTDDQADAHYVMYLRSGKGDHVVDCHLQMRLTNGTLLIVAISEDYREPTHAETDRALGLIRKKAYDQRMGLGSRYLRGGRFGHTHPRFLPDGKRIIFSSLRHESSEIYIVDITTKQLTRLTDTPYWEVNPTPMPDHAIVFESDQDDYYGNTWMLNVDGSNPRKLVTGARTCRNVQLSSDSKQIAVTCGQEGHRNIWTKPLDGRNFEQVSVRNSDSFAAKFATDREELLFAQRNPTGRHSIWMGSVDGSRFVTLDTHRLVKHIIGFVPSTNKVYFVAINEKSYSTEVCSLDIATQASAVVVSGGHLGDADYVLTNSRLYFVWDHGVDFEYEIHSLELAGNVRARQLTHERGYISQISLSADGEYILFVLEHKGARQRGKGRICFIPSTGGQVRYVCDN